MNSISPLGRWLGVLVLAIMLSALGPVAQVQAQSRNLPDFTNLVDQVGPSVVNIRTIEKVQRGADQDAAETEHLDRDRGDEQDDEHARGKRPHGFFPARNWAGRCACASTSLAST